MLTSMLLAPDAESKGSSCKSPFLLDLEFRLRRGDAGGAPGLEWLGLGRRELTSDGVRARRGGGGERRRDLERRRRSGKGERSRCLEDVLF